MTLLASRLMLRTAWNNGRYIDLERGMGSEFMPMTVTGISSGRRVQCLLSCRRLTRWPQRSISTKTPWDPECRELISKEVGMYP